MSKGGITRWETLNDGIGLPLEPIGYTLEEFRWMGKEGNPFSQEILENGNVLYGNTTI